MLRAEFISMKTHSLRNLLWQLLRPICMTKIMMFRMMSQWSLFLTEQHIHWLLRLIRNGLIVFSEIFLLLLTRQLFLISTETILKMFMLIKNTLTAIYGTVWIISWRLEETVIMFTVRISNMTFPNFLTVV